MSDKKITELPVAASISNSDISVLVDNGTDYQFAFSTLLGFIGSNLDLGAHISFGSTLPQNTTGKNGDVFINTTNGGFAQKIAGTWTVGYTIPSSSGSTDGTVLYGLGVPATATGNNNDTYINTGTGIFYKKSAGAWSQVFSMQTGPAGPQGTAGTNGTNGTNGKTILNGTVDPSNISTGTDGDFYINSGTFMLFGPKAGGVWPAGISLAGTDGPAGIGVPTGGTTGQVLAKIDGTDYNDHWIDPPATGVEIDDTSVSATTVYSSTKTTELITAETTARESADASLAAQYNKLNVNFYQTVI